MAAEPIPPRSHGTRPGRRAPGLASMPVLAALAFLTAVLLAGCAGSPLSDGGGGGAADPGGAPAAGTTTTAAPASTFPPGRVCTDIGCESAVTFRSPRVERILREGRPFTVTACLDDTCVTQRVPAGRCKGLGWKSPDTAIECFDGDLVLTIRAADTTGDFGTRKHSARLELTRAGENVRAVKLLDGVRFTRAQPNGPDCPPVCWNALLRFA